MQTGTRWAPWGSPSPKETRGKGCGPCMPWASHTTPCLCLLRTLWTMCDLIEQKGFLLGKHWHCLEEPVVKSYSSWQRGRPHSVCRCVVLSPAPGCPLRQAAPSARPLLGAQRGSSCHRCREGGRSIQTSLHCRPFSCS